MSESFSFSFARSFLMMLLLCSCCLESFSPEISTSYLIQKLFQLNHWFNLHKICLSDINCKPAFIYIHARNFCFARFATAFSSQIFLAANQSSNIPLMKFSRKSTSNILKFKKLITTEIYSPANCTIKLPQINVGLQYQ